MLNKFIRWYNKNRRIFWVIVFVAVIVINLPRVLNEYAKDKKEESSSISSNTTTYGNESYSIISEETVKQEINEDNTTIIDTFIEYCNNSNPKEAYKMLSNNCKEILYPTEQDFIYKYYNKIFTNKKSYDIQAWISNVNCYTYKINLKEDILSTGNADTFSIEDYYTIVYENGNYKLNINSYVGNIEINKYNETDDVKIEVLYKDIFMDYEIYNINVTSKARKINIIGQIRNNKWHVFKG